MKALDLEHYRALVEQSPTMIWRAGLDAKCDYFNATWLAFTGRALDAELGEGWAASMHPDDRDSCLASYRDHFERREAFEIEYRLRRHDDVYRYVIDRGAPYEDAQGVFAGFIGSCVDVDDRRTREVAYGSEFFAMSTDNLCVVAGFDGYVKRINPAWTRTLGWTLDELTAQPFIEWVHPEDREAALAARTQLKEGVPPIALVNRYRCKDGTYCWLEWRSVFHTDRGLIYDIARDVTKERQTLEALRVQSEALAQREEMFKHLFNAAPDAILVVGLDGTILLANTEAARCFGYAPGELDGLSVEELMPSESRSRHVVLRKDYSATPRVRRMGEGLDLKATRKDGSVFPADLSLGPFVLHGSPATLTIVRDITDRRRLEEQFRQSQKMEAIGSLAGGVAHDFNNILSVIMSYSSMLIDDLSPGDPMRADLEEIHTAGTRATDLTRQLLAFGRQQILQPKPMSLNAILLGQERMLRRLLGAAIEFKLLAAPRLRTVLVDASQVEQIVMNLVVNARDAMPSGGKLTIETANVDLDEGYVATHVGLRPGPYVTLAVSDTGLGMDKATQARVFEPFFTTKGVGKGTGLGLATVFGIVRQSGGFIWLYSEPGNGTTFKVHFPCLDEVADSTLGTTKPPSSNSPRGTETILLVEDEESVRGLACTILTRHGYHVLDAQSGGDALLLCEQHGATIHLLLTDVVMPRMSGRQLSERLKVSRPDMKVLFMSGYTDNSIVHHGVLDSGVAFLQKPITPEALTRKVREVLDGK